MADAKTPVEWRRMVGLLAQVGIRFGRQGSSMVHFPGLSSIEFGDASVGESTAIESRSQFGYILI